MKINKKDIISSGSGRLVLKKAGDKDNVIKMAINKFGKLQNENELLIYNKFSKNYDIGRYLPKVVSVDGYDIIEQEKIYPLTKDNEQYIDFEKYREKIEVIAPNHNNLELVSIRHVGVDKYYNLKCLDTGVTKGSKSLEEWFKTKEDKKGLKYKKLTNLDKYFELLNCAIFMEKYDISIKGAFEVFKYLEDYSRFKIKNSELYINDKLVNEKQYMDKLIVKNLFSL